MIKFTLVILALLFICCNDNTILLKYSLLELKYIEECDFLSWLCYVKDEYVYPNIIKKPTERYNVNMRQSIQIGKIGTGPGEYKTLGGIFEDDEYLYISDRAASKLIIYTKDGKFIKEKLIPGLTGKFIIINKRFIFFINNSLEEDFFTLYDIYEEKVINKFGELVEYPGPNKDKLENRSKKFPYYKEWDVEDSLLVYYNHYFDNLAIYNIFNGEKIRTIGRKHKGWTTPPIFFFKGDQYHKGNYSVMPSPCLGLKIKDNLIYVYMEKFWKNRWKIKKYKKGSKDLFIDIYNVKGDYIGTIFPLEDSIINYKNKKWVMDQLSISNEGLINLYLIGIEKGEILKVQIKPIFKK